MPELLSCQKHAFSLPDGLHYLNCAYMSPLPNIVELAGIEGIRRKRVPSKITPADFFEDGEGVRRLFADLIHLSHPDHIALIPSVSYGMAIVARNVPVSKEQNIVVLSEQFPSNIYPWRRMWKEKGVEIKTVSPPEKTSGRAVGWNTKILEAINADTAIVAMGHVHWADGTLFDLEAIGSRARSVGAALVIDGTQSIGALPFDVNKIQPDVLICAGYKWLLGPYGIGLAYFGPRFHDGIPLEENWIGRLNSDQFSRLVQYEDRYQPGVKRFDVGERSNFILIPMMKMQQHLHRLRERKYQ